MGWLSAYAVTLLVEIPVVLVLLRAAGQAPRGSDGGLSWPAAAALAWALNLTHPVVWWFGPEGWGEFLAAEAAVTAVEGLVLAVVGGRAILAARWAIAIAVGLLVAFAANLASVVVGAVLYALDWLPT